MKTETRSTRSSQAKTCQNCKQQFTIEPDDFAFYEKIQVPPPTFCPTCRMQRRLAFRNERRIFKSKSAYSGKDIFSLYDPASRTVVYDENEWWSDNWDPMSYGRDYDFSRPFFEQIRELMRTVPHYSRSVLRMVNSDYSANAGDLKNCYLCFNANSSEDSAYSNGLDFSKDCFDCSHVNRCERSYDSFWLEKCYETLFSSRCEECLRVVFSKNCVGCSDCFGCVNLRNKKFHIFNKAYAPGEYRRELAKFDLGAFKNLEALRRETKEFWMKFPVKFFEGRRNTSATGDYLFNSKNIKHGYLVRHGENLAYCQYMQVPPNRDCYDHSVWGQGNELTYECCVCGLGSYNIKFCFECWPDARDLEYCISCHSASNLFGCIGLRKKEYCIFNKQYNKEEYENLATRIKKHMDDIPYIDKRGRIYKYGGFFPAELSPYAYNDTTAQDHVPLNHESAERGGYRWRDPEKKEYETTLDAALLPDHIENISDGILQEILRCVSCEKGYRIIAAELAFLRKFSVAVPRKCPDCRYTERLKERNRAHFYHRHCLCLGQKSENGAYQNAAQHFHGNSLCPNEFETSYSPERPEIVYCESCYNSEVV